MQINATNNLMPVPEPQRRQTAPEVQDGARADFTSANAIHEQLARSPATRPEEVARVRSLLTDHYPPDEMVRRIANLLAVHIKPVE
jgi:hypothetical protein